MANFDIASCKYLTTSHNPTQYYLDVIKKYITKIVGPDLAKSEYEETIKTLEKKLKGDSISSPAVLHKVCFYTFAQVWMHACESSPKYTGKPFALEYAAFDEDDEEYTPANGFYNRVLNSIKGVIYDPAVQTMLSKPDNYGSYVVINFDELSNSIHRAIKTYYDKAEFIDKRLLESQMPNKELHESVDKSIKHFNNEIKRVIYNYKPSKQYGY